VSYTKLADLGGVFASTVTVTNTSKSTVDGWSLRWAFWGGQKVSVPVNAKTTQSGATVTASNLPWNARIKPGQSVTFAVVGQSGLGVNSDPSLFTLNGKACAR
jgi:endoglucanase